MDSVETQPTSQRHRPHGDIPNTPLTAAMISFSLGASFAAGILTFVSSAIPLSQYWWCTPTLGLFFASWALFHWSEFAVTAGWNREKCSVDSFLLNNGKSYHAANLMAISEYLLTLYLRPQWKHSSLPLFLGVTCIVVGQGLRSAAMIHASSNFSHSVQSRKATNHTLVTTGVYAWSRHPSYAGFFYWSLGTQLLLQNPLSFAVFFIVLWRFFRRRIQFEERALSGFFGQDYERYKESVATRIPYL